MRVYVGTTLSALRRARDTGVVGPAPLDARAVTPSLREAYAVGDTEELEYVALSHAAADSLALLAADADAPRRRVVVTVEAPEDAVSVVPDAGSAVLVETTLSLTEVAAIHVDDPAVDLTDAEGWELMWFATQELDALL